MRWLRGFVVVVCGGAAAAACAQVVAVAIDEPPDPLDGSADTAPVDGATGSADVAVPGDAAGDAGSDGAADADAADANGDAAGDAGDAGADADAGDPVLLRFVVVGDYGSGSGRELAVANLIDGWKPDLVVTTGDNDYASPVHEYDDNVGLFYRGYIAPYTGAHGAGAAQNAFFPAIGNHDWDFDDGAAYFDFFQLPGNERYYELERGPVHFVFLDSDPREPDGNSAASVQAQWAEAAITASASPFQLVVFHHPAYSSGDRMAAMDWPFKSWGVDGVLTGHVHNYERLRSVDGLTYWVVGQGGMSTSGFGPVHPSSEIRYNAKDGAQLVEVTSTRARFRYYDVDGTLIDDRSLDPTGAQIP